MEQGQQTQSQTSEEEDSTSIKGIKASGSLLIQSGSFKIDAADDAVHSNTAITVNGGSFEIASGDDAFHADQSLDINDGTIQITECYEGLEALQVRVSGGDITVKASDDGLNAAGGTDQSGANGLSCKVFLLSGYEVGFMTSDSSYIPVDGAKLDYFDASSSKRIAYLNGLETIWWLRSPRTDGTRRAWCVQTIGIPGGGDTSDSAGIRPALVLPSNALFDETTKLLKGVK